MTDPTLADQDAAARFYQRNFERLSGSGEADNFRNELPISNLPVLTALHGSPNISVEHPKTLVNPSNH